MSDDGVTRVYTDYGTVAHLALNGYDTKRVALCGVYRLDGFLGTGDQDEYETAAALPMCSKCRKKNGGADE